MRKNRFLLLVLLAQFLNGQVGINTEIPTSTLTVNGSIQGGFKEINTALYTITDKDFYLSYTGTTSSTITLPDLGTLKEKPIGRVYKIKNVSNYTVEIVALNSDVIIGGNTGTDVSSYILSPNNYVEVTSGMRGNKAVWVLSFAGKPELQNVKIYGAQVNIPAHNAYIADFQNHAIKTYDTQDWWVIEKQSFPAVVSSSSISASRMIVIYEYQGNMFDINHLYPILTSGNDSGWPDILVPVVKKLENINGKTRLTISIARLDKYEDWAGVFLLNVLLAKED